MADHKHGTMDISGHEKTFGGFVKFATRMAILILVLLVFITLANG